MSDAAPAGGPAPSPPGAEALAAAQQALDAAREAVGALVTVRAKALKEGVRLRERAEVPGMAGLGEDAALQERRAEALEPRIEQLRDLARRAELAYEALRSDRPADGRSTDAHRTADDRPSGAPDAATGDADEPEDR
ncbi:hypothetical protein [Patulibacter sp.]|uniref:hypothetical protein n=1 Tax=Patulibacter sp. TaxID=1912859 RepID=UPI00271C0BAF|nr:hypothetical protein [Patulibacter sp.]MDO9409432.1 hypothetical protein [Patulibacter sp.]